MIDDDFKVGERVTSARTDAPATVKSVQMGGLLVGVLFDNDQEVTYTSALSLRHGAVLATQKFQIGFHKDAPQYVLFRHFGCEGGNGCTHGPRPCPPEYDTYRWTSVSVRL